LGDVTLYTYGQPPLLRAMFRAMLGTALAVALVGWLSGGPDALVLGLVNALCYAVMLWLLPRAPTTVVGFISLTTLLATTAFAMWDGDGINDVAVIFLPVTIIVGALLLERLHYILLCGLVVGVSVGVAAGDYLRWLPHDTQPTPLLVDFFLYPVALAGLSLIGGFFVRSLTLSLERLAVSQRDYREIFDAVDDGIIVHDVAGNVVDVNQSILKMTGCDPEEARSLRIEDLSCERPEYNRDAAIAHVRRAVEAGPQLFEWCLRRRDGSEVPVEISLRNSHIGGEPRVLAVVRDISERHKLEDRIRQSEKLQAVGQLAGGVAHDFNNQLAGITGYAEMIRLKHGDRRELLEFTDAILMAARRSRDLTEKLLAFARKGKHASRPVDLRVLVGEVVSMLEHSIDPRIAIETVTADRAVVVHGDPTQLQNALLNLGINARDAMPEGGRLGFLVDVVDGASAGMAHPEVARIRVRDSGAGIPPEHQTRAFEPFFTTKSSGTGMGLAAVYGTVQAHRGTVEFDSELGVGTTFTVHLPLHDVAPDESVGTTPVPPSRVSDQPLTLRVLVVDDEAAMRDVLRSMFELQGAVVTTAADGVEAIAAFRPGEFDLVVLDMAMPNLAGDETFAKLRELEPDLPVILISGYTADGSADHLLARGARAFLRKPFAMHDLMHAVRRATRR
jgi:two-component system cell cycle sensor histidine kinase/response regulator CckA